MTQSMIVLADDLTGATELAGVARRFGFRAMVLTQPERSEAVLARVTADEDRAVLCYDGDTRRLSAEAAAARTYAIATAIAASHLPLFKKTDSLLRGHPGREIEALLQLPHWRQALLCPANPARGRTIRRGDYYVDGVLLAESSLADDPEHPRTANNVYELLQADHPGISVPDVTSAEDLQRHACRLTADVLPAGGAEFFAAILHQRGYREQPCTAPVLPPPWLLVCGSRTGWQQGRQREAAAHEVPCLFAGSLQLAELRSGLKERGAVWLAIGEPAQQESAAHWLDQLAATVTQCVRAERIGTLFLEGGATARAVLDRCGWSRFDVVGELGPGCVAMQADDPTAPLLVTKPGSYPWPDSLWQSRGPMHARPSS